MRKLLYNNLCYLMFLIPSLGLTSCKDEDSPSPQPVEEKNYWSQSTCKIDGIKWGDCYPIKHSKVEGEWYKNAIGQPLRLHFINVCDSPFTNINISLNGFTGIGSYTVSTDSYAEFEIVDFPTRIQYRTDMTKKGKVTITKFDTSNRQASGTYEFKAFNPDSNKTKSITNGVFNKVVFSVL